MTASIRNPRTSQRDPRHPQGKLRILHTDKCLISGRQRAVQTDGEAIGRPRLRDGVHHYRLRIQLCEVGLLLSVRLEHVALDLVQSPLVWWAGELTDHRRSVPLNRAARILMLMNESERMTELVGNDALYLFIRR